MASQSNNGQFVNVRAAYDSQLQQLAAQATEQRQRFDEFRSQLLSSNNLHQSSSSSSSSSSHQQHLQSNHDSDDVQQLGPQRQHRHRTAQASRRSIIEVNESEIERLSRLADAREREASRREAEEEAVSAARREGMYILPHIYVLISII